MAMKFEAKEGRLFVRRDGGDPEPVKQVNTLSRSYIVHPSAIGDAIRTRSPIMDVGLIKTVESPSSSDGLKIKLVGEIHGHPDVPDGESATTSALTGVVLLSGEVLKTGLASEARGTNLSQAVSKAANIPIPKPDGV